MLLLTKAFGWYIPHTIENNNWDNVFPRLLLKNILPLTEDHFIIGSIPSILNTDMSFGIDENWTMPTLPISVCNGDTIIQEHIIDYVDVGPMD